MQKLWPYESDHAVPAIIIAHPAAKCRTIKAFPKRRAFVVSPTTADRRRLSILSLLVASFAGCSAGEYPLAPVSGRVMLDGKPLAGGSISFQPIAKPGATSAGRGSSAFCDMDGRFTLATVDGDAGAVVGHHRVRIYGPKKQIASADDTSSGGVAEIVPARYNFQTTLTFAVPPAGSNKANFDLSGT
jgi:hypothetical protein